MAKAGPFSLRIGAGAGRVQDALAGEGLPGRRLGRAGGDPLGGRGGRGPQRQEQASGAGEAGDIY
jgi:hypothetical protein